MDEAWVYTWDPDKRIHCMEWLHQGSPDPKHHGALWLQPK